MGGYKLRLRLISPHPSFGHLPPEGEGFLAALQFKIICFILFFSQFFISAYATQNHFLIAPSCLIKNISAPYNILAQNHSLVLLQTTQLQTFIQVKSPSCGGFFDVTEEWQANSYNAKLFLQKFTQPLITKNSLRQLALHYPDQVAALYKQINSTQLWNDLTEFTNSNLFPDRFPNSYTGIYAAIWLQTKIAAIANENHRNDVTIRTVATGRMYQQPSVVVKIGNNNEPGIVLGAHMDTLRATSKNFKPGADDDGSGCMVVLNIARTLLQSGMTFKKPIYIIWYAAEESGLNGSQMVAKDFRTIPVAAVLQFDMTAYAPLNDRTIWLVQDNTNPELTTFLANLITTYVQTPFNMTKCGYACSDHASWTKAGIPAAFPFEADVWHHKENPFAHTSRDTIDRLSPPHMTDFLKLGLAFAVELAEPMQ